MISNAKKYRRGVECITSILAVLLCCVQYINDVRCLAGGRITDTANISHPNRTMCGLYRCSLQGTGQDRSYMVS